MSSQYELVYIVRPDVNTSRVSELEKRFSTLLTDNGGTIIKTENWGLKSLAYRIKNHRKGYYTMIGFSGTGETINEVERNMRINEDVIRFLTVGVDNLTKEPSVQMKQNRRDARDEA